MFNSPGPLEDDELRQDLVEEHQAPRTDADESREEIADQVAEDRTAHLAGHKSPLRRLIEVLRPSKGGGTEVASALPS
jgi:hypothetical protein